MNKKVKILVVEDDEATQYICEFALKNEGYQVVLAPNITEAKAALEETHFNLVLLDLNLPDGKGMSLVELFSSQPFLIMTICATPQERYLGFESGAPPNNMTNSGDANMPNKVTKVIMTPNVPDTWAINRLVSLRVTFSLF